MQANIVISIVLSPADAFGPDSVNDGVANLWWIGSNGYMMGRKDRRAGGDGSKSEQFKYCLDLEQHLHWLHLEPTHQYYTDYTLGAHSPVLH
jgi:hypothetical protein